MAVRAIALDIDGTLTNEKKVITPRTKEALLRAQDGGIKLIIASGRPYQGLRSLANELELPANNGLLVSYNGAHVTDAATDEVLFDQPMPADIIPPLLEHLRRFDVIPWITEGRTLYIEDAYNFDIVHKGRHRNIVKLERDACDLRVCEVDSLLEVCDRPQDKVLAAGSDFYLQEHWREMSEPFKDDLSCMFTADYFFEFMAPGVNKGRALAGALPALGIDAGEVVAFGDGQNDVQMLSWAGVGVAMANAVPEAREAADMVTGSNNEDGIASALEELLG